jgi:1,4-dihydroxy-2-naphthoate octaprenyltransferase
MFKSLMNWAKEFRLIFLLFVILPVSLGAVIALKFDPAGFSWFYFALSIAAILLLHAGTIALNDYFDYKSGNDTANTERTKYTGGTGLVPGVLSPSAVFVAGMLCFILCVVIGVYIVLARSFVLLPIGIIGIGIGYFYSAPPLRLAYRFLGEAAWFGSMVLMPLGAFVVQVPINSFADLSQAMAAMETVIVAALPLAFMGTVGIYILEFPDYNADLTARKWNLMTVFGRNYGLPIFIAMSALSYVSLAAGILLGLVPRMGLFVLVTIPLVTFAALGLRQYRGGARNIVQFIEIIIVACVLTGVIMILSFLF